VSCVAFIHPSFSLLPIEQVNSAVVPTKVLSDPMELERTLQTGLLEQQQQAVAAAVAAVATTPPHLPAAAVNNVNNAHANGFVPFAATAAANSVEGVSAVAAAGPPEASFPVSANLPVVTPGTTVSFSRYSRYRKDIVTQLYVLMNERLWLQPLLSQQASSRSSGPASKSPPPLLHNVPLPVSRSIDDGAHDDVDEASKPHSCANGPMASQSASSVTPQRVLQPLPTVVSAARDSLASSKSTVAVLPVSEAIRLQQRKNIIEVGDEASACKRRALAESRSMSGIAEVTEDSSSNNSSSKRQATTKDKKAVKNSKTFDERILTEMTTSSGSSTLTSTGKENDGGKNSPQKESVTTSCETAFHKDQNENKSGDQPATTTPLTARRERRRKCDGGGSRRHHHHHRRHHHHQHVTSSSTSTTTSSSVACGGNSPMSALVSSDNRRNKTEAAENPFDNPPMCLPEKEEFELVLHKDDRGLGITVAGYVCEKGKVFFCR